MRHVTNKEFPPFFFKVSNLISTGVVAYPNEKNKIKEKRKRNAFPRLSWFQLKKVADLKLTVVFTNERNS